MSLQVIFSLICKTAPKRSGSGESSSAYATQTACQQLKKFHQRISHVQLRQDITEFKKAVATLQNVDSRIAMDITKKAVHLLFSTNLLPDFNLQKSCLTSLNYLPPTCLHSSCPLQIPVTFNFHLHSNITKITPGHFNMGQRFARLR
jgi:hypothetical protein